MFLERQLANPKWAHSYTGMFWSSMVFYGGSPPSPPPAPPPPDYASANRAGVLADVQTLGAKKEIEQAAKLGGTALAFGVTTSTDSKGNVSYYQTFNDEGKRYPSPVSVPKGEAVIDFKGKSDIDVAKAQADFSRAEQRVNAQSSLDLQKRYGTQFATEARNQLQAVDPTGFANREALGKKVAGTTFEGVGNGPTFTQSGSGPQYEMASNSPSMSRLSGGPSLSRLDSGSSLERSGYGPSLLRQGDGPSLSRLDSGSSLERAGDGPSLSRQIGGPQFQGGDANAGGGAAALGRGEVERQLGENLFNNGKLSDEQARRLNNSVRGAQTARGNIYGNAPTAQEILTRSGAETDMARQARSDVVGYLQSGQSSYDIANAIRQESNQLAQQGYMNYSTANTVNNNLAQQEYQNQQAGLGQRNQASQTELNNRAQSAAFNNQASQSEYQNYVNRVGANNAMSQQEFQNQQVGLGQRNQASQTELSNRAQSAAFNNQTGQAEYQNYVNQVGANNAISQQEFQNQQANLGQRNQAQQSMYQNQLGANATNNQLAQQGYGNQLAAVQQRNAASQQGIANLQSYAGLQPIVTQGGQLSGLGQGAAPTIQTPIPQGVNINPNAGKNSADFALGVYGNQTSQYNAQLGYLSSTYATQQQYNSPLSYISTIGGAVGGLF